MGPRLVIGGATATLGTAIGAILDADIVETVVERFPDGECHVAIRESIGGGDVYIIQSTGPPVDEHVIELLMLVDASRRAGARRITVVIPYFGYARQDRRRASGEAVAARVVADLLGAVRADRVLVVDPHTPGLEALFPVPVEAVSAAPLLASVLRPHLPLDAVVVAPDLGAVKLAEHYSALLDRPTVVVRKRRLSGSTVRVDEVIGDVRDRTPVLVDDMITTGGTICAAADAVRERGARLTLWVSATHGVLVESADQRLGKLQIEHLLVTNSLPSVAESAIPIEVVSIARLLADAITRLHGDRPLDDLAHYV